MPSILAHSTVTVKEKKMQINGCLTFCKKQTVKKNKDVNTTTIYIKKSIFAKGGEAAGR